MYLAPLLRNVFLTLLPLSLLSSLYLYLYPLFHQCAFPAPDQSAHASYVSTLRSHIPFFAGPDARSSEIAIFRLLAFGDPQLEGDSSIPDQSFPHFFQFWNDAFLRQGIRHSLRQRIRHSLHDVVDFLLDDIPLYLEGYKKRLDLWGNDFYLAHIYRTLHWWSRPTHVAVLGDLIGSQWVSDEEFARRSARYWGRVFRHGQRVEDELTTPFEDEGAQNRTMILGHDAETWSRRVISIAGNHDIGYAGDLSVERLQRFETAFGRANYELRFVYPAALDWADVTASRSANTTFNSNHTTNLSETPSEVSSALNSSDENRRRIPTLRLIVLNSMNLDTPALSTDLQDATYTFLNKIITTSHPVSSSPSPEHQDQDHHFTLLLTHIPLYKDSGICTDGPFFSFFSHDNGDPDEFADVGGVKEQNHLSLSASKGILEGVFGLSGNRLAPGGGLGRRGLILTGHDHEGCDVWHWVDQDVHEEADGEAREWQAVRWGEEIRPHDDTFELESEDVFDAHSTTNTTLHHVTTDNASITIPTRSSDESPAVESTTTTTTTTTTNLQSDRQQQQQQRPSPETKLAPPTLRYPTPGIRELTLRSMMGDFQGHAGLVSLWFDAATWSWRSEISTCQFGSPVRWWAVHVLDLVTVVVGVVAVVWVGVRRLVLDGRDVKVGLRWGVRRLGWGWGVTFEVDGLRHGGDGRETRRVERKEEENRKAEKVQEKEKEKRGGQIRSLSTGTPKHHSLRKKRSKAVIV